MSKKYRKHRQAGGPAETAEKSMGRSKKRLFTLSLILIPFFVLALVETGLRVFHYGEDTDLFISAPGALGFPYGNNVMFPRILQIRLADAFTDRKSEVVNMGMAAISSYAMLDFTDEILKQKPDAILICAGHNEFYGAMAVSSMESLGRNPTVVRVYLMLERLKLFMWLRDCIGKFRVWMILKKSPDAGQEQNVTLMERIVSDEAIPYQGPIYEKSKKQFEGNLRMIVNKGTALSPIPGTPRGSSRMIPCVCTT